MNRAGLYPTLLAERSENKFSRNIGCATKFWVQNIQRQVKSDERGGQDRKPHHREAASMDMRGRKSRGASREKFGKGAAARSADHPGIHAQSVIQAADQRTVVHPQHRLWRLSGIHSQFLNRPIARRSYTVTKADDDAKNSFQKNWRWRQNAANRRLGDQDKMLVEPKQSCYGL